MPNQPLCDGGFAGIESVQSRIGFPFLEDKFDLPPESINIVNILKRKIFAAEIRKENDMLYSDESISDLRPT